MAKDAKVICPMMGGEPCVEDGSIRNGELVRCRFWVNVLGTNPQTNETINNGDCAIAWMPVLLIENSKVNRETGAAVESMRNENVTTGQQLTHAILQVSEKSQLPEIYRAEATGFLPNGSKAILVEDKN